MNVIASVKQFFTEDAEIDKTLLKNLSHSDSLIDKGILDSFRMLSLISFLEKEFCIKINSEDLLGDNFLTLKNIEAFIKSKR